MERFNVVKKELGLVNTKTKYFADSIDVLQLTSDLIYETDKIFPLKTIKFEGYEFKCPKDIEHTLEVNLVRISCIFQMLLKIIV